MPLKRGRVRVSTWFDEGSDALIKLDAICSKMGTTRGEVIRYIVIAWLESSSQALPVHHYEPQSIKKIEKEPSKAPLKVRRVDAAIDALDLDDQER
jgi:hypothetical protein